MADVHVVTGALGFTGRHIAARLLAQGVAVRTITAHPDRPNPFGDRVQAAPFNFENPAALVETLRGASVLYNTYWIRFPRGAWTFGRAVENSRTLIRAAEEAGVRRIVHVSIANPSLDSPLPYYRGKAQVEKAIRGSQVSYAILRPTVIFGDEGILIHNIAWMLRHMGIFGVPGRGDYELRPIFVEDLADLAVKTGADTENLVIDAVGPETYTFNDLLRLIREVLGRRTRMLHLPPGLVRVVTRIMGWFLHDIILTRDEVKGLTANLLVTRGPSTGPTRLSDWLRANASTIGTQYQSELTRHYRS